MAYFVSCLSSALVDEPICAVVRDLPPCRRVTIAVSTIDHERRQWSRAFDALVDFSGELDLTERRSGEIVLNTILMDLFINLPQMILFDGLTESHIHFNR